MRMARPAVVRAAALWASAHRLTVHQLHVCGILAHPAARIVLCISALTSKSGNMMKKVLLALAAAAVTFGVIAPAQAYDHHRVCHKVRVHHHWVNRCH
jgi:hypothetical protein